MKPRLRFPELTGNWLPTKLGDIAQFSKGVGISKEDIAKHGATEAIRYGELYTTYGEVITHVVSTTNLPVEDLVLSKANDLIIPSSGETHIDIATASCVLKDGVAIGGDINIIRSRNNGIFMAYYLNSKKKDIARIAQGVSVVHLYAANLKDLLLCIPSKDEQARIADFLDLIDKQLTAITAKTVLLRQYRKSLIQKIFTQQVRFKDERGRAFPAWQKKKLGSLIHKSNRRNKQLLVTYVQSVSNTHGFVSQEEYFDGRNIASKDTANYFVITKGTFAYNPSRVNVGSLAYKSDDKVSIVSPLYIAFVAGDQLADGFLLDWFSTHMFSGQMNHSSTGSVRNTLSFEALCDMDIYVPGIAEQQKIADFLSQVDKKVKAEEDILQSVRLFKESVLQRMFV